MSHAATTREARASQRTVDRITVRALRHAFDPDFDPEEAGLDLARLAGSGSVLRAAQSRVRHALDGQWSDVADRARDALDHATAALVPVSAPKGHDQVTEQTEEGIDEPHDALLPSSASTVGPDTTLP
jgi:hypothetical protein